MLVRFLVASLCLVGVVTAADNKIWTIATGHDWGGLEYIDENGYLSGFIYDLIAEVCAAAQIECRTIWNKYSLCWNSEAGQHSFGGTGLMSGWYDACAGWTATVNRIQVFDFSMPFTPPLKAFFYKKKRTTFDITDVSGKKIGFMDGFMSDEKCLARQNIKGTPLPKENIIHYQSTEDMIQALLDGKIAAAFIVDKNLYSDDIEKIDSSSYSCSSTGDGLMTRKDNGFNAHWNRGFQQIVANGRFRKLCKEAKDRHGHAGDLNDCV